MGKFLQQIEVIASNRFGKDKAKAFNEETRCIIFSINSHIKRNINSQYGKVVFHLWPPTVIDEYQIPPVELDKYSNVAMINIKANIEEFFENQTALERFMYVYDVFVKTLECDFIKEINLEIKKIREVIDLVKNEGFIFTRINKEKAISSDGTLQARLKYLFDQNGIHILAVVETIEDGHKKEFKIADYSIYEYSNIINVPARLYFEDQSTLKFEPEDDYYEQHFINIQ